MNFNHYVSEIKRHKGIVDPNRLFDFCVDYGLEVTDRLQIPHRVDGKFNPYVMKEAEKMMRKVTISVISEYHLFDEVVILDDVLKQISIDDLVTREFNSGTILLEDFHKRSDS